MSDTDNGAVNAKVAVNPDTAMVTMTRDGVETRYDLNRLPPRSMFYLAGRGLGTNLTRRKPDEMAKVWADFLAGVLPTRGEAKPKEPSDLSKAIAMAMRDELATTRGVKKADKAAYEALMAEATALVAQMSRTARLTARASASVMAYVAQIRGKQPAAQQSSLLSLVQPAEQAEGEPTDRIG